MKRTAYMNGKCYCVKYAGVYDLMIISRFIK